jgi:hypothetical protein
MIAVVIIGMLLTGAGIVNFINRQIRHRPIPTTVAFVSTSSPTQPSVTNLVTESPKVQEVSDTENESEDSYENPSEPSPTPTRKPHATPKPQPTHTLVVLRKEIEDLLSQWDEVHHRADRYWDTSRLNTVLRGDALIQQNEAVKSLRDGNCYWIIRDVTSPRISRLDVIDSNRLIVEVEKNWDMDLYCNGKKSGDDDGPFTMRYEVERIDSRWYITEKRVIDN